MRSPSEPLRLLVIGRDRAGKGTAAGILAELLGLSWRSSCNLAPAPAPVDQLLAEGHGICVGMRSRVEFEAVRHLFDAVIWVDGGDRVPPEHPVSMELNPGDADLYLWNGGEIPALEVAARRVAVALILGRVVGAKKMPGAGGAGHSVSGRSREDGGPSCV
ncbi:hypothetical protein [Salipiger bermudensis]|uniref:Uncharacterized protein n=1 Tax=Salipiger bermudensis (strain DSM 26914 / JCM 13377 / KCTC 12554 / HTCC2601) TaxID=314265 RepID=Q0FLQ0_SALBH|nr:hypothetical protein [Salipiger bermudensis]EAU45048.1 hypothetical protein R2601_22716 [Salipiger bermudensis HTCC2601]